MINLLIHLLCAALFGGLDVLPPDGPYIFYEDDRVIARWVDTAERTKGEADITDGAADLPDFPTFRMTSVDVNREFKRDPQIHFKTTEKIAVVSDIHGQFGTVAKLFRAHQVIDDDLHWSFGRGHLVIVGDIFDRGDQVTEVLWLVHNLQLEAEAAGGKLHFLLGNHETMILEGDDRYIHARYRITSGMIGKFYRDLFARDTYLGRWLRSLPLTVSINDDVYIHGGLSREMVREISSISRINQVYHDYLIDASNLSVTVAESDRLNLMYGRKGPLWYRGYFMINEFDDKDMDYVLRKIAARRIIVGHTSFTAIKSYFDNRLIAVDSSIKFGSIGEVLLIENGEFFRGLITGERLPLEESSTKK